MTLRLQSDLPHQSIRAFLARITGCIYRPGCTPINRENMVLHGKTELEKRHIRGTVILHSGSACSFLFGAIIQGRQGPPGQGSGLQPFYHYSTDHRGHLSCCLLPGEMVRLVGLLRTVRYGKFRLLTD